MAENAGKVIQVSGPAVDVQFEEATMPPIYQALRVTSEGFTVPSPISVVLEVQQHPRRADSRAGGQTDAGPRDQRDRRAGG